MQGIFGTTVEFADSGGACCFSPDQEAVARGLEQQALGCISAAAACPRLAASAALACYLEVPTANHKIVIAVVVSIIKYIDRTISTFVIHC